METLPSLQQICYDVLAEYAGYIEDLYGINNQGIQEICKKTNVFGLANMESLFSDFSNFDTNSIWQEIFQTNISKNPKFLCESSSLIQGPDIFRQSVLTSTLREQLGSSEMDDEDLGKMINFCQGLKVLELYKVTRLELPMILHSFSNLLHCSLKGSKVGPSASECISQLIQRSLCLQTLNLSNCILKDEGANSLLTSIANSKLVKIDFSWNDLTFASVQSLCELARVHFFLTIVILSKNLGPRDIKKGQILVNDVKRSKNIQISVV